MKKKHKMTPLGLERRIRSGIKRLRLRLRHRGYYDDTRGTVCAIGGALAYAAKDKAELASIVQTIRNGGDNWTAASAKILNHGLAAADMRMLEAGFEDYCLERGYDSFAPRRALTGNPYYRLGAKLREGTV